MLKTLVLKLFLKLLNLLNFVTNKLVVEPKTDFNKLNLVLVKYFLCWWLDFKSPQLYSKTNVNKIVNVYQLYLVNFRKYIFDVKARFFSYFIKFKLLRFKLVFQYWIKIQLYWNWFFLFAISGLFISKLLFQNIFF